MIPPKHITVSISGYRVRILNYLLADRVIENKETHELYCNSEVAYGICFMHGVNDESTEAAMNLARQVCGIEKVNDIPRRA